MNVKSGVSGSIAKTDQKLYHDKMSVSAERELHENSSAGSCGDNSSSNNGGSGSGTDNKMYRRLLVPDCKHSSLLPLVNIDKENYMLRGVTLNGVTRSSADIDFDNFMVCEINSTLSTLTSASTAVTSRETVSLDPNIVDPDDVVCDGGFCARIVSFHRFLCSCELSCCCMCGSFCSSDCYACYHDMCARFAAKHVCLKNDDTPPPVTFDHDKVSHSIFIISIIRIGCEQLSSSSGRINKSEQRKSCL